MRLAIVSGGRGWHVRDLERAAAELGLECAFVQFQTLTATAAGARGAFAGAEAALVRSIPAGTLEQTVFRLNVLHQAQAEGLRIVNPPAALERCVDKHATSRTLVAAGLPTPPIFVCQAAAQAMAAFAELGGDVVVKPLFGSEGKGMVRLTDAETAWRVFHAWESFGAVIYLQPFLRGDGTDLRVFVLNGRVLGAMRRRAAPGQWRTNVAQGAAAEKARLSAAQAEIAVAAAEAVGALAAGVDLLPTQEGQALVLEVNGVPGWKALNAAAGIDVGRAVVAFAAAAVA